MNDSLLASGGNGCFAFGMFSDLCSGSDPLERKAFESKALWEEDGGNHYTILMCASRGSLLCKSPPPHLDFVAKIK